MRDTRTKWTEDINTFIKECSRNKEHSIEEAFELVERGKKLDKIKEQRRRSREKRKVIDSITRKDTETLKNLENKDLAWIIRELNKRMRKGC